MIYKQSSKRLVTIRLKTKFSSARDIPITITNNLQENLSARGFVIVWLGGI